MASEIPTGHLIDTPSAGERVEPARLIRRFGRETSERDGIKTSRGFCGLEVIGIRDDLMASGFDDGYAFMGFLTGRGWKSLPAKGDWPFVVYLYWKDEEAGHFAIAEYCEGDLTIWEFADAAAAKAFYDTLRNAP